MTYIVAVAGYPSSGKSLVTEIAKDIGFQTVIMGDYVREQTKEQWGDRLEQAERDETDELPSDVYREFATEMREQHGRGVVADWCRDDILASDEPTFVDGIRSPEALDAFKEFAYTVELVFVHAPASIRLDWIQDRGRDGEDEFDAEQLLERDQAENQWGVNELIQDSDYTVHNCTTEEAFEDDVRTLLTAIYNLHG